MPEPVRDNGPLPRDVAVAFIPVIRKVAHNLARRMPPHVCVEDLKGAGFIGLIDAYRRFDALRGDHFDAYAEVRIRGAMLDELRANDPLTRDMRAHTNRAASAVRTIEARHGRAASESEVAGELGLSVELHRDYSARAAAGTTLSIDAAPDGEAAFEMRDTRAALADDAVAAEQSKRAVRTALDALPPRLRQVVQLYYGEELSLRDIGGVLGVTESRVSQLHSEAILRLKARCADSDGDVAGPVAVPTRKAAAARARS